VEIAGWSTSASLPADAPPTRVVFDTGGRLVAEVRHARPIAEVLDQLRAGRFADRLRAARQLARDFPRREEAVRALAGILADPKAHWGLRQEAALDLGTSCGEGAAEAIAVALGDADRRVRRAAAVAAAGCGGAAVETALRALLAKETAEDVAAVAARSVGRRSASPPSAWPRWTRGCARLRTIPPCPGASGSWPRTAIAGCGRPPSRSWVRCIAPKTWPSSRPTRTRSPTRTWPWPLEAPRKPSKPS
jgi:hypothetical protein